MCQGESDTVRWFAKSNSFCPCCPQAGQHGWSNAFKLMSRMPLHLLAVETDDRKLLQLLSHSFRSGEFETVTATWDKSALRLDGVSKSLSLVASLEIQASGFLSYDMTDRGAICLKTERLTEVLDYLTHSRHSEAAIGVACRFNPEKSLRVDANIQGWGKSNYLLRHFPDSMLPKRPRVSFDKAAWFTTNAPKVLRDLVDVMASTTDVRIRVTEQGVSFVDNADKEHQFKPAGIQVSGKAETLLPLVSLNYASKIVDNVDPETTEVDVIDRGLARVTYTFAQAALEYLVVPVEESE